MSVMTASDNQGSSATVIEANPDGSVERAIAIFPGMLEASRTGNCARLRELGEEAYDLLAADFPLAAEALRWQAREDLASGLSEEDVMATVRPELGPYLSEERFPWLFATIGKMTFCDLDEVQTFCREFREHLEGHEGRFLYVLEQAHAQDLADAES